MYGRLRADLPASALTHAVHFSHAFKWTILVIPPRREPSVFAKPLPNCRHSMISPSNFSGSLNSMARQIGNAVPVLLARRLGEAFLSKTTAYRAECEDGHL